jgi:hypothetical protein
MNHDHPKRLECQHFDETSRVLSVRDSELFIEMLETDSAPNDALRLAAERYRENRRSAREGGTEGLPNC